MLFADELLCFFLVKSNCIHSFSSLSHIHHPNLVHIHFAQLLIPMSSHHKIIEETPAPVEEIPGPVKKEEEEEGEELECTICHRPPTILTEDLKKGEEEDDEKEEVADVGSSTTKQATKRKACAKKVVPKFPEAPTFDNIFLHPKPAPQPSPCSSS